MTRHPLARAMLAAAALALSAPAAPAHPVPFSFLDVRLDGRTLDGTLVVHVVDAAHALGVSRPEALLAEATARAHGGRLAELLASRVRLSIDGGSLPVSWAPPVPLRERQSLRLQFHAPLAAPPGALAIDALPFPYDPAHRTFVNVYEGDALTQAILDEGRSRVEYFTGTRQGVLAVAGKFLPAGIHHILIGPDHVLFLVGLLLAGGSVRRLAIVVSGFTVGHSLTLSLAALDLVNPPSWAVEPVIALSIVYVGADNLFVRDGRDVRTWVALLFGLVHGFGFAGVLRELQLPARALGWSLASFNAGVEVGQLLIVALVAVALATVRARSQVAGQRLAVAGSLAVMACGAFWFVERTLFPGGV